MASIHVRHLETREIIHSVEVANSSERDVERILRGMLINLRDDCFLDSTEVYDAIGAKKWERVWGKQP
jgi:hypothetical protein